MKFFFLIAALAYLTLLIFMYFAQDKLIYRPDITDFEDCEAVTKLGAEIRQTDDLRFYEYRPKNPSAKLIYFHGRSRSACARAAILANLIQANENITIIVNEYPGYARGGKSGNQAFPGYESLIKNAENIYKHVYDPKLPVIIYGESLGSLFALYLASRYTIHGLILHAPMPSLAEAAQYQKPYIPVRLLLKHDYPAAEWARKTNAPTLVLHGTEDKEIPIAQGRKLYDALNGPKEFVEIPEGAHGTLPFTHTEIYWPKVKEFLSRALGSVQTPNP